VIYATLLSIFIAIALFISIKSFIFRFYILVNFALFTQPAIVELIFGTVHPMHVENDSLYIRALIFVNLWNVIFGISFIIFSRIFSTFFQVTYFLNNSKINSKENYQSVLCSCFILILISILAKWKLFSLGGFQMTGVASSSPLLQLYKLLATFDLFTLIFLGEYKKLFFKKKFFMNSNYFLIAVLVLVFAFFSGSRSQIIYALIIILISHREFLKRHIVFTTIALSTAFPFIFIIFPFIAFLRNNNFDFNSAFNELGGFIESIQFIIMDVLSTRLNYLEILGKVISYVDQNGIAGGAIYLNNIIGIIPRAIWPGKPSISNDSHQLGHDLGLLQPYDTTTSIGLRPIGEAFFEFGFLGFFVAIFYGILFSFFYKQFSHVSLSAAAFTIYLYSIIYLVTRDGIFAIIPGLIYLFIGWFIFFTIMSSVGLFFRQILASNKYKKI
tara:strand:+ start:16993 stop:18318 length:1326 start_codon:yes stop_codon:yes gene_type:complete